MSEGKQYLSAGQRQQQDSSRQHRLLPALKPGYFQPDEYSFEDLLQLAHKMAAQLNFYDLKGHQAGHWNTLFDSSEAAVVAAMLSVNPACEKKQLQHHLQHDLPRALDQVLSRYLQLDTWLTQLFQVHNGRADSLRLTLTSVIETQLARPLVTLIQIIQTMPESTLSPEEKSIRLSRLEALDNTWGIQVEQGRLTFRQTALQTVTESGQDTLPADDPSAGESSAHSGSQICETIQLCSASALNGIEYLQSECRDHLDQWLNHADQPPALGLFLAFLKLMGKVQLRLNQFTERHLDFYYRDLLQFTALPATPDTVWLKLSRDMSSGRSSGTAPAITVSQGFPLSCGQDEQLNDVVYHTDESLVVTDARVAQVRSLFLKRDGLISPERELHYVTGIQGELMWPVPDAPTENMTAGGTSAQTEPEENADKPGSRGMGGVTRQGIRVLGETPDSHGNRVDTPVGIAFSDPVLLLKEGRRRVSIRVSLGELRQSRIQQLLYMVREASSEQQQKGLSDLFSELLSTETDLTSALVANTALSAHQLGEALSRYLSDDDLKQLLAADVHIVSSLLYKYLLLAMAELLSGYAASLTEDSAIETLFFRLMGRLFCRHTLSTGHWLTGDEIERIKVLSDTLLNEKSASRIRRLLNKTPQAVFYELYKDLFNIRISGDDGWFLVPDYRIHPLQASAEGHYGFRLEFTLSQSAPAVVACGPTIHGDIWTNPEPAIRLEIRPEAAFFPYSVFRSFALTQLDIETHTEKLTDIQIYNRDGQSDPAQPFTPFGAQPGPQSWCVLGNYEMARKQLTQVRLRVHWADLPDRSDGFTEYYQDYETEYRSDSFRIALEALKDGNWSDTGPEKGYTMFRTVPGSGRLAPVSEYVADLKGRSGSIRHTLTPEQFNYSVRSRDGLFRLILTAPGTAFGHQEYAPLLSQRLMENARIKKPKALPVLPYTPTISQISLGYSAHSRITPGGKQLRDDVRIIHLHPFGHEQVWPAVREQNLYQPVCFFPRYAGDGNLFIGLEGSELRGRMNLFFRMDDSTRLSAPQSVDAPSWYFLNGNQWQRLDDLYVIADSTQGFMTSGIITLDLPAGLDKSHTVMPDGLFWLRVSTAKALSHPGNCLTVATHVVPATRVLNASTTLPDDASVQQMALQGEWQPLRSLRGLGSVAAMAYRAGNSHTEQPLEFRQRVSERLRHKGRAVTPWDYERLVLEHFPEIDRVRCFSGARFDQKGDFPGHLLIIVRKKVTECSHSACGQYRVSARLLNQIRAFLQSVSSPFVRIDVRNPEYERVQVRCTVTFNPGEHHGLALRRLNQALCDYLCPWHEQGMNQGFGWQPEIRQIEAFISRQSYVCFVTDFSVLQICQDDLRQNLWQLKDSAQLTEAERSAALITGPEEAEYSISGGAEHSIPGDAEQSRPEDEAEQVLRTRHPWHLLMPVARHYLIEQSEPVAITACKTGVGELEVGDNFIVSQ